MQGIRIRHGMLLKTLAEKLNRFPSSVRRSLKRMGYSVIRGKVWLRGQFIRRY